LPSKVRIRANQTEPARSICATSKETNAREDDRNWSTSTTSPHSNVALGHLLLLAHNLSHPSSVALVHSHVRSAQTYTRSARLHATDFSMILDLKRDIITLILGTLRISTDHRADERRRQRGVDDIALRALRTRACRARAPHSSARHVVKQHAKVRRRACTRSSMCLQSLSRL
jgi:hypothetical protein